MVDIRSDLFMNGGMKAKGVAGEAANCKGVRLTFLSSLVINIMNIKCWNKNSIQCSPRMFARLKAFSFYIEKGCQAESPF